MAEKAAILNLIKANFFKMQPHLKSHISFYSKATQIYLIVLPIFFSIGAVGWREKKNQIKVFNFF